MVGGRKLLAFNAATSKVPYILFESYTYVWHPCISELDRKSLKKQQQHFIVVSLTAGTHFIS
jgi:hypothetical protein